VVARQSVLAERLWRKFGLKYKVAKENSRNERAGRARNLSEQLLGVGQLIDRGSLGEARLQLEASRGEPAELLELMRLKLSVAERQLEPSSALQSVIAWLRKDPQHPFAMGLYQEFSMLQYQAGQSCPSHSHPPPPERAR
jgi:hypothetical protein